MRTIVIVSMIVKDVINLIDVQRKREGITILSTRKGDALRTRRLLKTRNTKEVVPLRNTSLQVAAMNKVRVAHLAVMIVAQTIVLTAFSSKQS